MDTSAGTSSRRVVVAAAGPDDQARLNARALLMSGREVVFVGGGQTVDQTVATVIAEDPSEVVVDASSDQLDELRAALSAAGCGDVTVTACQQA